jgi:hypothetical protein
MVYDDFVESLERETEFGQNMVGRRQTSLFTDGPVSSDGGSHAPGSAK